MIRRPVFRRMLAEDVELRALITHLLFVYKQHGVGKERVCHEAKVMQRSLTRYLAQTYPDYTADPRWKNPDGSTRVFYIGDEGILRMAEYLGISVELKITLEPTVYDKLDERLAKNPGVPYNLSEWNEKAARRKNSRKRSVDHGLDQP